MNIKKPMSLSLTLLAALQLGACENRQEEDIELNRVPANIIGIVQSTLPGISLTGAEKEIKGETIIYELEGKMPGGHEYEIKIREDGLIIEIELED